MSKKAIMGAFLGGALVGTASLFFAPKKGTELRRDVQIKFAEAKEKWQTALAENQGTPNESDSSVDNIILGTTTESDEDVIADNPEQ